MKNGSYLNCMIRGSYLRYNVLYMALVTHQQSPLANHAKDFGHSLIDSWSVVVGVIYGVGPIN